MPEELIDLSDIFSHVVRHTVTIGEETCWATIVLRQVCVDFLTAKAKHVQFLQIGGDI
jgi:hypothetical protein